MTVTDEMVEAAATALYDVWQGAPNGRTWQECCEKLPGQASIFRKKAKATLEAALAVQAKQEPWQPIETAPKDGSSVILFGDLQGEVFVKEKRQITVGIWKYNQWNVENTDAYSVIVDATHWMTLPEPPTEKGGDAI